VHLVAALLLERETRARTASDPVSCHPSDEDIARRPCPPRVDFEVLLLLLFWLPSISGFSRRNTFIVVNPKGLDGYVHVVAKGNFGVSALFSASTAQRDASKMLPSYSYRRRMVFCVLDLPSTLTLSQIPCSPGFHSRAERPQTVPEKKDSRNLYAARLAGVI